MRKVVVLAAAVVAALGVTASSATSAASETGVTARTIVVGGTFPLTGPASLYAPIPSAMKAYFSYINSRKGPDGERGVFGRQIVFNVLRRRLQPREHACSRHGSSSRTTRSSRSSARSGPSVNEAIRPYLNARKVPQVLNATGASAWSARRSSTRGPAAGSPTYDYEARDLRHGDRAQQPEREDRASSTRTTASARSNLDGLKAGLGAKASNIVGEESLRGHRGRRPHADREASRVAVPRSS